MVCAPALANVGLTETAAAFLSSWSTSYSFLSWDIVLALRVEVRYLVFPRLGLDIRRLPYP